MRELTDAVITAFGRLRSEDCYKYEESLVYVASSSLVRFT